MEQKLKEAVETLVTALSEDKSEGSYYYSWQANIAMAFKDEFDDRVGGIRANVPVTKELVHEISNNAAKRFLDLLCRKQSPEE
jgi:hypothetical protein